MTQLTQQEVVDGRAAHRTDTNKQLTGGFSKAGGMVNDFKAQLKSRSLKIAPLSESQRPAIEDLTTSPEHVNVSSSETSSPVTVAAVPPVPAVPAAMTADVALVAIQAPAPTGRLDPTFDQAQYLEYDRAYAEVVALNAQEQLLQEQLRILQQRLVLVQRGLKVKHDGINVAFELHELSK